VASRLLRLARPVTDVEGIPGKIPVPDRGSIADVRSVSDARIEIGAVANGRVEIAPIPDSRIGAPAARDAAQERIRTYRAVYHIADQKLMQLADATLPTVQPADNGKLAIGSDDRKYRSMVDYDGNYSDLYLVDTLSNQRTPLIEKFRGIATWSPKANYALAFKKGDWWSIRIPDGYMTNLTSTLPVKFFSPAAGPNAADAAIAVAHAVDKGAKVINLSWHVAPGDDLTVLKRAMQLALANDCLLVIAAGNDGTDNEIYPTWPAKLATQNPFKNKVLTVLASDRYDAKASFSNYGASTVHLAAPGTDILATGLYLEAPPRYAEYSGTSPAAAYASAAAALVFALNPAWKPVDVVQHLTASARTVDALRLACLNGKRLDIGRAVYGPLRILSPRAGDELPVNQAAPIVWSNSYSNARFTKVKIEFHDGTNWTVVKASTPNDGFFSWTPANVTATGRIRLTPVAGNFPVVSETFRVV